MLNEQTKQWLVEVFGSNVRFDEPMSRHTSFGIGGPAEAYVAPKKPSELSELLKRAFQEKIPYFALGGGTNLLVGDNGIEGLVIFIGNGFDRITKKMSPEGRVILSAMAGANLPALCSFAAKNGLSGMNFAMGIPGTVGGAAMMRASSSWGSMEDVVDRIQIIWPDGETETLDKNGYINFCAGHFSDFGFRDFGQRFRDFEQRRPRSLNSGADGGADQNHAVISNVSFELSLSEPDLVEEEARMFLAARRKTQPGGRSAGCFFKNPEKGLPAGQLIEMAGLKGKQIGDAWISDLHANFIMNRKNASAKDVLELMTLARDVVFEKFNVHLEPEVKIVGM